jgi:hypothetical protein
MEQRGKEVSGMTTYMRMTEQIDDSKKFYQVLVYCAEGWKGVLLQADNKKEASLAATFHLQENLGYYPIFVMRMKELGREEFLASIGHQTELGKAEWDSTRKGKEKDVRRKD